MADVYEQEEFPFKVKDIIKVTFDYSYKQSGIKDKRFKRIVYFQILKVNSINIEKFFSILINSFLKKGFCLIQSCNIRWDKIKVESALRAEKITLIKNIKSVYGALDDMCDVDKGFLFNLYPSKGGVSKRFYLRGTPDVLNYFDTEDSKVKDPVISIEKLFLEALGDDDCSFSYVTMSKSLPNGFDQIVSAEGTRMHIFAKRLKTKNVNVSNNNTSKFK